jgi:hypothetical protein
MGHITMKCDKLGDMLAELRCRETEHDLRGCLALDGAISE